MGFSDFIRERQFLSNVTPSTLEWYRHSFKWLDTDSPTQEDLKTAVLKMRAKGLRATGCNSAIRAINAYVHWVSAGPDAKCSPACRHPKIAELKEPQNVLPTFTDKQIRLLVEWKPKGKLERRLHLILLFLFDSGARISEVLKLRVSDINLDDLLVTLDGKGRKQRVVPISFELRKAIHRYITDFIRLTAIRVDAARCHDVAAKTLDLAGTSAKRKLSHARHCVRVVKLHILDTAVALDQRCNYVMPKPGLEWKLVGAVVTSSLFALSVESYGNATMGAGALELATRKLPEVRVPDITNLGEAEKAQLIALVKSVWKEDAPVEWGTQKQPEKALRELDTFLLALIGAEIPLAQIYADLNDVVRSRILISQDKEQTTKSHQRVDVAAIARSIALSVQTLLDSKRFPDDFYDAESAGLVFDFTNSKSLDIECVPMLNQAVVDVRNAVTGETLLNAQYPRPMAQVIVRALLLGRRRFVAPSDLASAEDALQNFDNWLPTILERVEEGARMSATGTRYEQQVLSACFKELKLDVRATPPQFYGQARLQ